MDPGYEYSLLFPDFSTGAVVLTPDAHTSRRHHLTEALVPGKPLKFENGVADVLPTPGAERIEDMLSDGVTFGVRDHVRDIIERHEHPGLQVYPMVFTDATGMAHRDYSYLNLYGERDFLDRQRSNFIARAEPDDPDDADFVLEYKLDVAALGAVPLGERLIFRLKRVMNPNVFVHQSLLEQFEAARITGYRAFRVAEFREGMQH